MNRDRRTRPDITPLSKYPDLEKPGVHALMQLLKHALMTTRGDIIFRGADYVQRLAAGTEGQVPHYDANGEPVPGDIGDISGVLPATKVEVAELGTATYDDVQDYINFFGNRTILSGGGITATSPADGTVIIAACAAWCKISDSDTAVGKFFNFAGKADQTLTDLTANIIYLDYNAGTPQIVVATAPATYGFRQDHILIGVVYRDGNDVHIVQADLLGIQGINRAHMHTVEHHGPHRSSGMVTSAAGTRNLSITAGVLYLGLIRKATLAFDTSRSGTADEDEANKLHDADGDFTAGDVGKNVHNDTDNTYGLITAYVNSGELTLAADTFPDGNEAYLIDWFSYWYYDGDLGTPAWVEVKGSTQISNTQYNDVDTGLASLGSNKYGVHWVYMELDGKHIHIVYGQGDYTAPQVEGVAVPSSLPDIVTKYGVLIAKIICQEGTDTLTIAYPWTTIFMTTLATDHGSLAGLGDDDHAQYIKDAEFTASEDILVGTGSGTFAKKTPAEIMAILSGEAGAAFSLGDQILSALKGLLLTAATELTMDTNGAITVTQMVHTVDTFEDAASDNLDTINGGTTVGLIIIRPAHTDRTVVIRDGQGNIELQGGADISLDDITDHIMLFWDTTNSKWVDFGGGGGGVAAHAILDGSVHTDSVADAVTRGSLIYGNATPKWDELGKGADGTLLKSGADDIAWDALADFIDKTHFSQDFGPNSRRLLNISLDPISGYILGITNAKQSVFSAKINGNPTSTVVPYDTDVNEDMFNGLAEWTGTTYWGKIVLYNTTKSESVLIERVNLGANLVVEANSPDDSDTWDDDDVITCLSSEMGLADWFDVDMSAIIDSDDAYIQFFVRLYDNEGNYDVNRKIGFHPYYAYAAGDDAYVASTNAGERSFLVFWIPNHSNRFCCRMWTGFNDVAVYIAVRGVAEYADT